MLVLWLAVLGGLLVRRHVVSYRVRRYRQRQLDRLVLRVRGIASEAFVALTQPGVVEVIQGDGA